MEQVDKVEVRLAEDFRPYRNQWTSKHLQKVFQEQHQESTSSMDFTDVQAAQIQAGSIKISCKKCFEVFEPVGTACPACKSQKGQRVSRDLINDYVSPQHAEAVSYRLGEVIDVMPNSYGSCKAVLASLKEQWHS